MKAGTQWLGRREELGEGRYRAMFEGAGIGIGICDSDGRVLEVNGALVRMLGYSGQELAEADGGGIYPGLRRAGNGDNFSVDERLLGELRRGEREWFEVEKRYRRKDESEFWGSLTVSLAGGNGGSPLLIATLADATERRRVEEHLREAAKMEVIGRLAGGIVHDFNNLLTGILLYCDLLSAGLELGRGDGERRDLERSDLSQHVEEVRLAGEQGAGLTRQLLAIARRQAAEPELVGINEMVASMENFLRRLIGEQIELVTALDRDAGLVVADPAQLRQVLMNLVLNARDALPRGGKIWVITRVVENPESRRRGVSLMVKDNGCGMDAETRARLFEPFFTTKNPGKGTGLGLATVERIVSAAGGRIEVESEEGRGSRVEVFLPAAGRVGSGATGQGDCGQVGARER